MKEIIRYLSEILPIFLCSMPLLLLWRFFTVKGMKVRGINTTVYHETGAILLAASCIYILVQTVWAQRWCLPSLDDISLIPFRVIGYTVSGLAEGNSTPLLINFIGNIAVFMPIGLFYGLCYPGANFKRAALLGLLVSFTAETGQLFSERCTDVDDLWMNTLGAVLGFCMSILIGKCFPHFAKRFKADCSAICCVYRRS